jgi:hypothetical protein
VSVCVCVQYNTVAQGIVGQPVVNATEARHGKRQEARHGAEDPRQGRRTHESPHGSTHHVPPRP